MKNVFLDFGSNRFKALHKVFIDKLKIDSSWVINCYEPNKTVFETAISDIKNPKNPNYIFSEYPNFNVYNIAVSDITGIEEIKNVKKYTNRNGDIRFCDGGASTLLKDVIWHPKDVEFELTSVKTLSINDILEDIYIKYGEDVNIYIKCDIEGYEYKVIRKLLHSQHTNLIKKIYIEWHPHLFTNQTDKRAEAFDLIVRMYRIGIESSMHY